jgi:hypothetical protein
MEDQPVDRNREFNKKKKSGDRLEETHSTHFLIIRPKQCMQRRVTDNAEYKGHTAQDEPGPLRPTLVGAPQAPARQSRASHNIEKTRHSRYIGLRPHARPFS